MQPEFIILLDSSHCSSRTELPGPPTILLLLARAQSSVDGMLQGYQVTEDSPGFCYRDGFHILPRALSGAFRRIMYRAGLEGYRCTMPAILTLR